MELIKMNKIEESKKIQDFLSYREGNTKKSYTNSLKKFLKWFDKKYTKIDFDSYLKDIRLMEIKEKIAATDQYEKDILNYLKELKTKHPPKTISTDIAIVKSLLRHCRIDLDNAFWDQIKRLRPGNATVNESKASTQKELKEILTHANTRQRAIFMTMITSGLRVGEVCSMKMKDIDLNHAYPRIKISYAAAKNKKPCRTRVSPETKSCILEWLKIRDNEIIKSYKRQMNFGTVPKVDSFEDVVKQEDRLFPFETRTIERIWNELLAKAGYDEKNDSGIHKRNVHSLRRVFRTQYGKYNNDLAEYFMNHISELDRVYDLKDDEWLDQEYGKGLRYLTIFETVMDESDRIKDINKQMKEKDVRITKLEQDLQDMDRQLRKLLIDRLTEDDKKKKD